MNAAEYWDLEWKRRAGDLTKHPEMNVEKLGKIFYELTKRLDYADMEKLDIGCGTGIHALHMGLMCSGWRKKWTGIDLSENAVRFAVSKGLNAICGDIFQYETDKRFGLFLLLDTFEHIFDDKRLAEKIKSLAEPSFSIFGNVPMYSAAHVETVERPIGIKQIVDFLFSCGMQGVNYEIYGAAGWPYCLFEGRREDV